MNNQKNIITAAVVVLIIGSIIYLESHKQKGADVVAVTLVAPEVATSTSNTAVQKIASANKSVLYPRAVELSDPRGFINTDPFTLQSLVGKKVVLIDFWTYSCINCQRTLPYLKAWYQKYKDIGLEIVGVHTPEFDFEKNFNNVQKAVTEAGITYPVVLDSNYGTWNAYKNRFWPHELLVDIDGYIVHDHAGEGSYGDTEHAIQQALKERSDRLGLALKIPTTLVDPNDAVSMDTSVPISQETYFGSARSEIGAFTLVGDWKIVPEYAESPAVNGQILYDYMAKNVYFVASSQGGATVVVKKDGVVVNTVKIQEDKLYQIIGDKSYGEHKLELDITGTLDAFTFTFG